MRHFAPVYYCFLRAIGQAFVPYNSAGREPYIPSHRTTRKRFGHRCVHHITLWLVDTAKNGIPAPRVEKLKSIPGVEVLEVKTAGDLVQNQITFSEGQAVGGVQCGFIHSNPRFNLHTHTLLLIDDDPNIHPMDAGAIPWSKYI